MNENKNLSDVNLQIREINSLDWPVISQIYEEGIRTGNSTFGPGISTWNDWNNIYNDNCRFAAESEGNMRAWAALSEVSGRCVHAGVAEVSIYVSEGSRGQSIGTFLLQTLIEQSEMKGYWTLQSGIFPENLAAIHIHEKTGFRLVGIREKLGRLNGVWRDVLLLERRSKVTGIN